MSNGSRRLKNALKEPCRMSEALLLTDRDVCNGQGVPNQ